MPISCWHISIVYQPHNLQEDSPLSPCPCPPQTPLRATGRVEQSSVDATVAASVWQPESPSSTAGTTPTLQQPPAAGARRHRVPGRRQWRSSSRCGAGPPWSSSIRGVRRRLTAGTGSGCLGELAVVNAFRRGVCRRQAAGPELPRRPPQQVGPILRAR